MFRAVGIKSMPKGGFGNRVLNYLNVRHIARTLGVPYFNANTLDRRRIEGISKPWLGRYIPGTKVTVTRDMVQDDGFFEFAKNQLAKRHTLVFKPRLLDDTFAKVATTDSRLVTRHLMTQCASHRAVHDEGFHVVLHLRGTDFWQWNPEAILRDSYYIDAVESLRPEHGGSMVVRVCTDDANHPALQSVQQYLRSIRAGAPEVVCESPFECDFSAMAESDVLVSSPSTFALVAGLLGSTQVIHSKSWVESRANNHEFFWQKLLDGEIVGLRLRGFI